ncbi:MAG: hypothetical protein IPP33_11875 [Flavobacteriales bacterium]|nr:hypothetical protein [Flavobacteriales bacterium]
MEVSNSMASAWRAENKGELSVYGMLPLHPDAYENATTYDVQFPLADKAKHAMLALGQDEYQVVRLFKHEDKTPDQLKARHTELATAKTEPDRTERHECYQAAGERVAAYCHLLIAITDGVNDNPTQEVEPGAKRILNVKLRGLTPELTSGSTALSFADTGPVFWLNAFSDKDGEPPVFKFLDPSEEPNLQGHREPKELLVATGERNLRAIASALDRYNQEPLDEKTTTKAAEEWRNALTKGKESERKVNKVTKWIDVTSSTNTSTSARMITGPLPKACARNSIGPQRAWRSPWRPITSCGNAMRSTGCAVPCARFHGPSALRATGSTSCLILKRSRCSSAPWSAG